ncbi:beta strand repeat-containing protein [Methylovulum miyakonense]|uniref:beta strand repeat-containing protein n=1 Tax=Methylovulum miyakonense TaxID=645578 RepID=UPI000372CD34|nr:calcium-binding protein [Methylovulum miyakonense]
MATYKFSTAPASIVFTTSDFLIFDVSTVSASSITITGTVNIAISDGSKTVTLTGFNLDNVSSANFIFADGSKLQIGDDLTTTANDGLANSFISTDSNDYFDGRGGNDTVSYATATSAVTVDLTVATAQNTGGGGTDKLISVENITGSSYNDTLTGNTSNNYLDGGAGVDAMTGGAGNDTYIVNASDTVTENASEGTDTVISSVDYVLGVNVENLTLAAGAVSGTGNGVANIIIGNSLNNILTGGAGTGNDNLQGGAGDDTYFVSKTTDVVNETAAGSAGIDLVVSSATYTLSTNVDNLRLTAGNINGTGNALNNIIYAGSGNNTLDGAGNTGVGGADTLSYQYGVSSTTGVTVSLALATSQATGGSGSDTISNFENLTGSNYSDVLTGNAGVNVITGGYGNDSLNGGTGGADTLVGGFGDDTYTLVDATTDVITELALQGTDTVTSALVNVDISAIANVENVSLTGALTLSGTGNASDNTITGNSAANTLTGNAGNDTLIDGNSEGTTDTLVGGLGDDTYQVNSSTDVVTEAASQGTDTVISTATFDLSVAASVGVEKLTLSGASAVNGTGNALDNTITGNGVANSLTGNAGNDKLDGQGGGDTLDGGLGIDTMLGGDGDDTYVVDNASDTVTELAGQGTDTVRSSIAGVSGYTLTAEVENLILIGSAVVGTGNAADNTLTANVTLASTLNGGAGNDTLNGLAGADKLDGGVGADIMSGGDGNDTYIVDTTNTLATNGDQITDGGTGIDLVQSSVTYTIFDTDVENLTLTGSTNINATGNASVNTITGNTGNNIIDGLGGADIMSGGAGNDTYVVDTTNTLATNGDQITENAGAGTDLVQSSVTYTIFDVDVENLTLTGSGVINATGNASVNTLTGNGANNILNGLGGADTMVGGDGNDTYVVDNVGDKVTESPSQGTDLVQSSVTYTITNINVENLTLTGSGVINATGNGSVNTIIGNTAANLIDGKAGADIMSGGDGNDTYVVDTTNTTATNGDQITDGGTGTDLVQSSVTYTIFDTAVENLTLTGSGVINGTGNVSANIITGNAKNNVLDDGGAGAADTLIGGVGDDTYNVNNSGDTVTESASQGTDTVVASVSYTLTDVDVENLTLSGTATTGIGNASANTLTSTGSANSLSGLAGIDTLVGAAGADTLIGGLGKDTLTGNAGNDIFQFATTSTTNTTTHVTTVTSNDTTLGASDVITDFTQSSDVINLHQIFDDTGAGSGSGVVLTSFTGTGAKEVVYEASGSDTVVLGDIGGDGVADFEIILTGFSSPMAGTDFVF